MPATPGWLAPIEAMLARNIDASAAAAALARRLEGKALEIEASGLLRVRLQVLAGHLALIAPQGAAAPDAVISGSPAALLQLLSNRAGRAAASGAAQVRGDAEVAALFRDLFALARPDAEEELSRFLGDVPAHQLMRVANRTVSWLRNAGRTAAGNLAEYLQEESRDLVNATELGEFLSGVDALREAADRLDAKLSRLERRIQAAS